MSASGLRSVIGGVSKLVQTCAEGRQYAGRCTAFTTLRHFSASPDSNTDTSNIGNEKVRKLADEILGLSVLESSWLTEILRKKLGMAKPAFGAMPAFGMAPQAMGAAPAAGGAAPAASAQAAAPKEEKKEEKTTFDIKLESFTADGKIKVIKEIRAITNLGLKEAKELVSGAVHSFFQPTAQYFYFTAWVHNAWQRFA